jgi:hypothetical protein
MSEMSGRKSPEQRLRFFRFGLLAITGVAFALGAVTGWIASLGGLMGALWYGSLWGAGVGVICVMIYFVYKAFVVKPD